MNFRDQLLALEPEAIGGEMEGIGLYTAAQGEKVDWILVKAICDWADGNKETDKTSKASTENSDKAIKKTKTTSTVRDQKIAARNAAQFVIHVLLKTQLT